MAEALIQVDGLTKHFPVRKGILSSRPAGHVRAVDGISFTIEEGETVGLVGESGCGKTTTSKLVLRLEQPTAGKVTLRGNDIHSLQGEELKAFRSSVQAVFQDPWSSLNPRMRVRGIVCEALVANYDLSREEVDARVALVLKQVGLSPAMINRYPHEFSGGQRQRIALAAALASRPQLIVLDEPVSALDVSIRAQVMNLLKDIQEQEGVAYLLIAHDLATVRYMARRTAVMYLGQIVEYADTNELFTQTLHPYTRALLSASLSAFPGRNDTEIVLSGEIPSPLDPPGGCRFHTRCPLAMEKCRTEVPKLRETSPGHQVSCHLY